MKNKNKIKEYFFLNPTIKLRVRQMERKTKVPIPSVIKYTKELEKEKILKSTIIAGIKVYSADRTSRKFKLEKTLFNIKSLSKLTNYLIKKYSNSTIILFGSYSKGEDIENSDIDIYIETQRKIKNISEFERQLQRNLQFFRFNNMKAIKNKELSNNIINGITLNGFVEVF